MTQQYQPGQRWISDGEAEQGLGTVLACDGHLLTILYPATGETRQYSQRNAPLTRVRFEPGDEISHFDGWTMTVREVSEIDGLLIYQGFDTQNEECLLPETQLSNFIQFRVASDRLVAGQVDPLPWFTLRYNSLQHNSQLQQSELWGLAGARAQPIAHQLHIAQEVADRIAPRVLLADEVGLGKTIEAGLIIHRQLLTGRASRILLMVPETLQHQWLVEMRRRFNLDVTLFDAERFQASDADNPFEDCQIALVAMNWLVDDHIAQQSLLSCDWDIMVVDEAHHLVWHPEQSSPAYQLVEALAAAVPGVLLLTATPEQLGQDSHFARLRLLDPHRFHDLAAFREESQHYQSIADAVNELLEQEQLSSTAQHTIESFLGDDSQALISAFNAGDEHAAPRLVRELLDRHGTGRLLFRNTRAAISGFPKRKLHPAPLACPEQYQNNPIELHAQLYPDLYSNGPATLTIEATTASSSEQHWWQFDPRVDWLLETLKSLKQKKVLVICAHAETALDLGDAMRIRSGIPATTFHEGMNIIERDRAAAWFAEEEFGAQVMFCSEIGSEGRNFQFSHHLVLFDLPQHPDLLEQRIGRLDRIGQQHTIEIHVPYFTDTAQQRVFEWYQHGLNAFLSTCPTGNALQLQFSEQLETLLLDTTDQDSWQTLLDEAVNLRKQLESEMEQGRDRLLEINSSGAGRGQALVEAIEQQDNTFDLPIYMEQLFNAFGIHSEDHSDNAFILRPSEKMLDANFPLGSDEAVTITYNRELALSREDMQFITWEHPMVQGGMDLVLSGSMGNTAVALLNNKAIPPGTMLVELLYVSEAIAPKHLQLGRFLPPIAMRCLLDDNGTDLASQVSFEVLNDQLKRVPRSSANKFARAQREKILGLVDNAQNIMQPRHTERVEQASAAFSASMDEEIARLSALQAINPNVRDEEIDTLRAYQEQGLNMFKTAALRLEAIRVLVAG